MEVLVEDAGRILHWHLVPCEGHHFGAEGEMERVERCPLERCRVWSNGHKTSDRANAKRPTDAPSVVDPERFTRSPPYPPPLGERVGRGRAYSFGERAITRCFPERPSTRGPFA